MKIYAVLLPLKDEEKSNQFRPDHLAFLERMRKEKKVLFHGRFTDGTGGLVIYRAKDEEEVLSYVKQDPFVVEGARSYEIHEWDMVTDLELDLD